MSEKRLPFVLDVLREMWRGNVRDFRFEWSEMRFVARHEGCCGETFGLNPFRVYWRAASGCEWDNCGTVSRRRTP